MDYSSTIRRAYRDAVYGATFIRRLRAMGIRDRPPTVRSPWENGCAERLIGSIRRECLDHVVVFGERHLRHLLKLYQEYYNEVRTHLSLNKDAPVPRSVQAIGCIVAKPLLGGLHHQYVRIDLRLAYFDGSDSSQPLNEKIQRRINDQKSSGTGDIEQHRKESHVRQRNGIGSVGHLPCVSQGCSIRPKENCRAGGRPHD